MLCSTQNGLDFSCFLLKRRFRVSQLCLTGEQLKQYSPVICETLCNVPNVP